MLSACHSPTGLASCVMIQGEELLSYMQLFISYAHADEIFVQQLDAALAQHNASKRYGMARGSGLRSCYMGIGAWASHPSCKIWGATASAPIRSSPTATCSASGALRTPANCYTTSPS